MPESPDTPDPGPEYPNKSSASMKRFMARGPRDHLWAFLDLMDARPALKRLLLVGLPVLVLAVGLGAWGYGRWSRTNAIRIARQWLDAGRLDRAGVAIKDAIENEPDVPESWQLASALAWQKGNKAASVEFARKAAEVSRYRAAEVIGWGDTALLADDDAQAREALARMDPLELQDSARALRLGGELSRRAHRYAEARDDFQRALRADQKAAAVSLAIDEVPLGIALLQTGSADDRALGQGLLRKWAQDPAWGIGAIRALLADAEDHGDKEATMLWAEGLRKNPHCTLGDIPVCLRALSDTDEGRFRAMLNPLEGAARMVPVEAAQVLGWLSQIGRAEEAVRWGTALDRSVSGRPPVAQGVAEALRATGRWAELEAWTEKAEWGQDLEFLGWAYGMAAARHLGEDAKADSLWSSLAAEGVRSPAHALFIGDSLYAWGYPDEAAKLLWQAADRPDLSYQALGTLARLYQVQGDAAGQYHAFTRLNAMRPGDRDIANNFAYFAALTDLGSLSRVEPIAESNFNSEPSNLTFRSTYAFVLVWAGQGAKAMAVMEPVSREWKNSRAVAFSYASALASVGRKADAKEIFASLDPRRLSPAETEWVRAELR